MHCTRPRPLCPTGRSCYGFVFSGRLALTPARPTTPADRASPLLRDRVRAIFKQLPRGLAGDEEAIHQMRVAGRRLRVALPLLARKPQGKRVKRALRVLRALTRAAGASRDLDVSLTLLVAHLDELPAVPAEQANLRRRLRAARTRSRGRMAEALLDLEIAGVRRDLRRVLARKADDLFTLLGRVRSSREVEGQAILSGFSVLGERYEPDELHALRRRIRRLRYTAEVADALLRDDPSEAPALFKSLQEQIGSLHDVHVLARWLEAQGKALGSRGRAAEAEAALALQGAFDARGHELHARFLEGRPAEQVTRGLAAMGRARTAA
jgi:CHAD domain-containing protein